MQPKTKQLIAYFILVATIVALLLCLKTSHLKQEQIKYTFEAYEMQLAALDSQLLKQYSTIDSLENKDDSIVYKYRTIIKEVPTLQFPEYQKIYSDWVGSEVFINDTVMCLSKPQTDSLTIKLYKGVEGLERLKICQKSNEAYKIIINGKDSVNRLQVAAFDNCKEKLNECAEDVNEGQKQLKIQTVFTRIWQGVTAVVALVAAVK